MLNIVKTHEKLTKEKFGYVSKDLPINSHKLIVVECEYCHSIMEREFRNLHKFHQCPIVVGNRKRCFKCKEWKDLSLFNKCCKLSGGVAKMCRECYNSHESVIKCEINRKYRLKHSFQTNIELYFKKRAYQISNHSKRNNIKCDLDFDFLFNLWNQQNGKCYYSGMDMVAEGKVNGFQSWRCPSLDRKIPANGYIKGNVVWCCFSVNSFKQNLTDEEFLKIVKEIQWKII